MIQELICIMNVNDCMRILGFSNNQIQYLMDNRTV